MGVSGFISINAQWQESWVLLVSVNPGGPNGGSATQYFVGDFDGKDFKPYSTKTKWMDYGTDNYAGVTFANTGERTILMGWMSNWQYAGVVPTSPWRSATTVPRTLGLTDVNKELYLTSTPVNELDVLNGSAVSMKNVPVKGQYDLTAKTKNDSGIFKLDLTTQNTNDFSIVLANDQGNEVVIGYDKAEKGYYIDRSHSGKTDFEKGFGKRHTAPRISPDAKMSLTLLVDAASVELFADNGLTVMTDIFFPDKPMTRLFIKSASGITVSNLTYTKLTAASQAGL